MENETTYYHNLYFSEKLIKKKDKIIKKFEENKLQPNLFVVTLARGEQNQLEFFQTYFLQQRFFENVSFFVVGFADSYGAAVELVHQITKEAVAQRGDANIRQYLLDKEEDYKKDGTCR